MINRMIKELEDKKEKIQQRLYTPEMAEIEAQLKVLKEIKQQTLKKARIDAEFKETPESEIRNLEQE